jgi:alkanesulfonate monooxygenase SsuD/methylene tetrahydromethanopterin reductase-like flavin-dependent oxidoreductase (luciferase family)
MRLSLSVAHLGYHPAAWRLPGVPADGTMNFAHYVNCARIAERGALDFLFLADVSAVRNFADPRVARDREQQHAKHEPLTLIAALAAATRDIGLVATASTSFQDPYNLARRFATVDHISGGRAAWNMVTSWSADEARNFGLETTGDSDTRHARASEFAALVKDLWSGEGLGPDGAARHAGRFFTVDGSLDVARPPQGHLPLATAGASDNAQEFAAAHADIVYAGQPDLQLARNYYASVKARLPRYGRTEDSLLIMPGVMTVLGRTEDEAQEKLARLSALLSPEVGYGQLVISGFPDLSLWPIDGPIPDFADDQSIGGTGAQPAAFAQRLLDIARAQNSTIRQFMEMVCAGNLWQLTLVGTPKMVADRLEEWFVTRAADGFNLQAAYLPGAAEDFVELVLPELRRRGLFREGYAREGETLRERLGLAPWRGRAFADSV